MAFVECTGSDKGKYQIIPDTAVVDYRVKNILKAVRKGDVESAVLNVRSSTL